MMFCSHITDENAFAVVNGVQTCLKCRDGGSKELDGESVDERRRNKAARQREIARKAVLVAEAENRI